MEKNQENSSREQKSGNPKWEKDGYVHIFEWTDAPNTVYEEHEHKGRTAFIF